MTDVTRILSQIEAGGPSAAQELLPLGYEELRSAPAIHSFYDGEVNPAS